MKKYIPLLLIIILAVSCFSQVESQNKGIFLEPKQGFFSEITEEAERFNRQESVQRKTFKADLSNVDLPSGLSDFVYQWHTPTVSQGITGTCWSFSTTSFLESEVYRINKKEIKISELFTVYWEYVEKAKRFVEERGNSRFSEGSEGNAVIKVWKKYGAVPEDVYNGLMPGQVFHDHRKMVDEMTSYLANVKNQNNWNESEVISTVKSIMNHYIGEPPSKFSYNGSQMTPQDFLKNVIDLNLDDYIDIMSLKQQPYFQKVEYEVPDNWWHSKDYYNVPLDEFMSILNNAVRKGYTVSIGGDVSEAGYDSWSKAAIVPTFDIPPQFINEDARQFRFSNETTTDDHGIHLVGYAEKNGTNWYLIKDSGSGSKNMEPKGYYYYREDYIKLKMMGFMVHKDAVDKVILSKFTE